MAIWPMRSARLWPWLRPLLNSEKTLFTFSSEGVVSAFAGSTVRVSNSTITGNLTVLLPDSGGLLLTRRNNTVESNNTAGAFTGVFTAK